ncbi:MAG: polysaccharide deacetylase family protein [Gammaproteobacteria bacterium]
MIEGQFPVLMYHGIQDSEDEPGHYDPVYNVTHQQFSDQLDWLKNNDYKACTLDDALKLSATEKVVVITFDDGDITNYTAAFPQLMKRAMPAEFYITTDWIGNEYSMSADQLRELDQAGMAVDSHGKTHKYLSDLNDEEMRLELEVSKKTLEEILGKKIYTIALPGGRGDHRTRTIAKQLGYTKLGTSALGYNDQKTDPYKIKRIAMTRPMSIETFASLVSGEGNEMRKMKLRQFILTSMKTVLGNRLYEVVRGRLLG